MSLIEILFSITILIILMGAAATVFRQDSRRGEVNAAVEQLSGVLDLARWEARSKSTYVWVCLKKMESGGDQGMRLVVYGSRDGTSDGSAANLRPLTPVKLLKNINVPGEGGTPERLLQDYTTAVIGDSDIRTYLSGSTWAGAPDAIDTLGQVIGFTPCGEAFIPGKTRSGLIEVIVEPFQQGADSSAKSSSLLVSCSTGSVQVYR